MPREHQRILLLGPTGVSKTVAINKVIKSADQEHHRRINLIDFERDALPQARYFSSYRGFLFGDMSGQAKMWIEGWEHVVKRLDTLPPDDPCVLSMHGVLVTSDAGTRSVIDIASICRDFKPTLIITLADDVFSMWWRTEARAKGDYSKGRPTLEQLLEARRAETLVGDLVAYQNLLDRPARHVFFSVNHPVEVLRDIIIFDAGISYLSFPISAPRDLLKVGDASFRDGVNDFHRRVVHEYKQKNRPKLVYVSPLSIDELPLAEVAAAAMSDQVLFDPSTDRWSLKDLWGNVELLADAAPERSLFPKEELQDVIGLLKTDVAWRDYRLVRQSESLGVYCPKAPNRERISRGVEAEIRAAVQGVDKTIYIWQNPEWDPHDVVGKGLGTPGAMGMDTFQRQVRKVDSLGELVSRILSV